MANKYAHLREKAISLRREHNMALDDLVERLQLPRTTIYYWIKDIPIPYTEKQTEAQRRRNEQNRERYAALREEAYQQGWQEAPTLLEDLTFRDFVVLYMAEGTKRNRNQVSFVNSDVSMMILANHWITQFTDNKIAYRLQYHVDELKDYWGNHLGIDPDCIKEMRKSNSNELSGRQFRSKYGILTIEVDDTYLRARLQAWMDYVKKQW